MSNPGTTSLIAWWTLNEESGTRVDSHGSNDLSDNATVLFGTGVQGNAADFTRTSSEYLSIADNTDVSTGDIDFTFACWVNMESQPGDMDIISKYEAATSDREYRLWYDLTNAAGPPHSVIRWYVDPDGAGTSGADAIPTAGQSTATWYFVVVWHDSVNNQIAIQINDGTPVTTAYTSGVHDGPSPLHIGAVGRAALGNFYDGLVDEIAFYKRILTSAERTWLYNTGSGRTYSDVATSTDVNINVSKSGDFIQVVTP